MTGSPQAPLPLFPSRVSGVGVPPLAPLPCSRRVWRCTRCLPTPPGGGPEEGLELTVSELQLSGGGGGSEQSLQPWGVEENVCLHLSFHLNTVIWFLFRNV